MKYIEELKEIIEDAKTVGVISHINPDADNLGSLTALSESLRQLGKDVYPICIDPIPYNLQFLYGIDLLVSDFKRDYDIVFVLDSSDENRLGEGKQVLDMAKTVVGIDHHISNDMEMDFKFLDVEASSTGQLLYEFLKVYDLPVDTNIAESIFTAIVGDSGSFRYDTVSKKTFEIAASLMDYNIDKVKIDKNLYGKNRLEKIQMLKLALDRLEIHESINLATTYILVQDYIDLKAEVGDIEGIVETIRDIEGIEVALLFKENRDNIKVSSRSKTDYDVRKLAETFSGGGHKKAAGFTIESTDVEETMNKVVNEYERTLTDK